MNGKSASWSRFASSIPRRQADARCPARVMNASVSAGVQSANVRTCSCVRALDVSQRPDRARAPFEHRLHLLDHGVVDSADLASRDACPEEFRGCRGMPPDGQARGREVGTAARFRWGWGMAARRRGARSSGEGVCGCIVSAHGDAQRSVGGERPSPTPTLRSAGVQASWGQGRQRFKVPQSCPRTVERATRQELRRAVIGSLRYGGAAVASLAGTVRWADFTC